MGKGEERSIVPVLHVALELTNIAGRMGVLEEEIIQILQRELGEKYGIVGGKARCDGYEPLWYDRKLPSADDEEEEVVRPVDPTRLSTQELWEIGRKLGVEYPGITNPKGMRSYLIMSIVAADPNALALKKLSDD